MSEYKLAELIEHGDIIKNGEDKYQIADARAYAKLNGADILGEDGNRVEVECVKMETKDMNSGYDLEQPKMQKIDEDVIKNAIADAIKPLKEELQKRKVSMTYNAPVVPATPASSVKLRAFKDAQSAADFGNYIWSKLPADGEFGALHKKGMSGLRSRGYSTRAAETSVTSPGSFLVEQEFNYTPTWMTSDVGGVFRSVAANFPMTRSGTCKGFFPVQVDPSSVINAPASQDSSITDVSNSFTTVLLQAQDYRALTLVTRDLLQDNVFSAEYAMYDAQMNTSKLIDRYGFASVAAFANGVVGLGRQLITDTANSIAGGTGLATVTRQNIIDLQGLVLQCDEALANYEKLCFVCSGNAFRYMKALDTTLSYTTTVVTSKSEFEPLDDPYSSFKAFGFPVRISNQVSSADPVGTGVKNFPIYFGLFDHACIFSSRQNFEVVVDPYSYLNTNSVGIYSFARIAVKNFSNKDYLGNSPVSGVLCTGV